MKQQNKPMNPLLADYLKGMRIEAEMISKSAHSDAVHVNPPKKKEGDDDEKIRKH